MSDRLEAAKLKRTQLDRELGNNSDLRHTLEKMWSFLTDHIAERDAEVARLHERCARLETAIRRAARSRCACCDKPMPQQSPWCSIACMDAMVKIDAPPPPWEATTRVATDEKTWGMIDSILCSRCAQQCTVPAPKCFWCDKISTAIAPVCNEHGAAPVTTPAPDPERDAVKRVIEYGKCPVCGGCETLVSCADCGKTAVCAKDATLEQLDPEREAMHRVIEEARDINSANFRLKPLRDALEALDALRAARPPVDLPTTNRSRDDGRWREPEHKK